MKECFIPTGFNTCGIGTKIVKSNICEIKYAEGYLCGKKYLVASVSNMYLYDTVTCCFDSKFAGELSWNRFNK